MSTPAPGGGKYLQFLIDFRGAMGYNKENVIQRGGIPHARGGLMA